MWSEFKRYRVWQRSHQWLRWVVWIGFPVGVYLWVYWLYDFFHAVFGAYLGLPPRQTDAIGAGLVVLMGVLVQWWVSRRHATSITATFFIGSQDFIDLLMERVQLYRNVIDEVRQELKEISTFNPVPAGQIGPVVNDAEKISDDIAQRLQAINKTLSNLDDTDKT
ncbi:MAG: hypothetical protein WCP34_00930 [Pseudomonadota bacterium]